MILCIGTTPALQRVMVFRRLELNAVNRAVATHDGVAGKSINVAKVLKTLGENPFATGFLGGDRGEHLRDVLEALVIEHEFVPVAARTRQCVTVVDETAGTQTELVEECRAVDPSAFADLTNIIRRRVAGCRAVVMSGTIAPDGPIDLYRRCTELARAAGAFSVVDAQGPPLTEALKSKPDLVKPNRAELAATVGRELPDQEELRSAMQELRERGAGRVVVTAGGSDTFATDGDHDWRITAPKVRVVNPIGSGDAFTAAWVARWLRGGDLGEACRWGCATGTANALSLLAGEVDLDDVQRLLPEVKLDRL